MATAQFTLSHRIVLAPLTRNRATEPSLCPHNDHVEYYTQRATPGGLLITEAVNISPEAVGYVSVPGIWTEEQTSAWRAVTNSVHAKGGKSSCNSGTRVELLIPHSVNIRYYEKVDWLCQVFRPQIRNCDTQDAIHHCQLQRIRVWKKLRSHVDLK